MAATEKTSIPADEVERIIARRVDDELERRLEAKLKDMVDAARLGGGSGDAPSAAAPDDGSPAWVQALAMSIAQLTDQGTGRSRRVAPEVLVEREQALHHLMELLVQARSAAEKPRYRLLTKQYLNDQLVDPTWIDQYHIHRETEISWEDIPNSGMRPANDSAHAIFREFSTWVGGVKRPELAQKVTRGGLTIVTGAKVTGPWAAERPHAGDGVPAAPSGFQVHRGAGPDGAPVTTAILGTIHPPAVQQP